MVDKIRAWSYSRLADFEACRYRAKLKMIDKIPEPERQLPPGKTEFANDRGTRIHLAAERFVRGEVLLVPELKAFETEFIRAKELFAAGKVSLEGEWGFDKDWGPTDWRSHNTWARVKLDMLAFLTPTHALVVDYKTGRKFGNEIKHADQMQLYQLSTFLRYPKLERVDVELWYLDQDDLTHMSFSKDQGLKFFSNFNRRGQEMTNATAFPPRANIFTCRWCPYKGTEHCEFGVE